MLRFCPLIRFLVILCSPGPLLSGQVNMVPAAGIERLSAQAEQALRRGNYATAAASYEQILKLDPTLVETRANLGLTYHLMGRYEDAVKEFESVLSSMPKLFTPNFFLGVDLVKLHKNREALSYLQRAVSLRPHSAEAAAALARDYEALFDPAKAADWFDRALQIAPQNADAWYGMGIAYLDLEKRAAEELGDRHTNSPFRQALLADSVAEEGWSDETLRLYQNVLASSSTVPYPHSALGFTYLQRGNVAKAEEQFQAELAQDPGCLPAQLGGARIDLERGNLSNALQKLTRIRDTDPGFFETYIPRLWAGWTPEKINAFEESLQSLEIKKAQHQMVSILIAAIDRWGKEPSNIFTTLPGGWQAGDQTPFPTSIGAPSKLYGRGKYSACTQALVTNFAALQASDLVLLSQCSYYAGAFQITLRAGERLLALSPLNPAALFWEAKASKVLAIGSLARVGLLQPDSPRTYLLLGRAYEEKGLFNEAKDEYQNVVRADPQISAGHLALAQLDMRNMEFNQALPEVQAVLRYNPGNPEACYIMSLILTYQHQYAKSLPYLKAALHGPPSSLPRVHGLIGKVYASEGRAREAIVELTKALPADDDGSYHYQLFLLYRRLGDIAAATAALRESNAIRKEDAVKARERLAVKQ